MRRQPIRRGLVIVSALLFPVTMFYMSPALVLHGASLGIMTGSMILFAGQFVVALLLGRAFCGWLCPGSGLGQICRSVRDEPAAGGRWDLVKWVIWVPWVAAIVGFAVAAGGLHTIDPFFMIEGGISVSRPEHYIIYFFFVGLILLLALWAGRHGFCHYACWMAPFMILGTKLRDRLRIAGLNLRPKPDACTDCGRCATTCPMSLNVPGMVRSGSMANAECILCGECVDTCRKGAISFAWMKAPRPVRNVTASGDDGSE